MNISQINTEKQKTIVLVKLGVEFKAAGSVESKLARHQCANSST